MLSDQLQDGPETFRGVKIRQPTSVLPGVDGEQLQGVLGGQRPLFLQFPFTLKEEGERQMTVVQAGGVRSSARAPETAH